MKREPQDVTGGVGQPGRVPRLRRLMPLVVVPVLLFLASCASDAPQDTLEPEGPIARKIDNLVNPVFLIAAVVFVFVEVGVVVMAWRFRRRREDDDDALPPQVHGNTKAEIGWTVVPAIILGFVGFFTLTTLFAIDAEADDATMTVKVIGQQWWWAYEYDVDGDNVTDITTANDLIMPAGTTVNLEIESRDVIHSYWIPKLNGKKDAVPGRVHELTVAADDPGTYVGECGEYCGLSHSYMNQRLVALSDDDYQAWVDNQLEDAAMPTEGDAAEGAEQFVNMCSRCHLARGINDAEYEEQGGGNDLVSGTAPDLTHFASRGAFAGAVFDLWLPQGDGPIVEWSDIGVELNTEDLEAWLRDPPAEKPMAAELEGIGRGMPNLELTEDQIDNLVAFLETLD